MKKLEERPCSICRGPLHKDPEKVFRVNREWENRKGELLSETKELAEKLNGGSFCRSCSEDVRLSGLKVVSVAEIGRWGRRSKANSLLKRIGENQEKDVATLEKKFRVVRGRG